MARTYFTTSSTALSTFTGNTNFNEKVALTFTPEANTSYAIFWSAVTSGSSITNVNSVRLQKTTGTAATLQQFEIDRDDLLEEQSLTSVCVYTAPSSPTEESFAIEGQTSVNTDSIYISDAHITAVKLNGDDVFSTASASTSTNTNTYSTTDSITVGAGDWYIFGGASLNVSTTTIASRGLIGVRINDGTNTYMEHDSWFSENANNWTPYWAIASVSPTTSTTYNLQFKDGSAGTTSLRYRTLLALKKSGFYESFYNVDESLTTTQTVETTKLTLTATPTLEGNTLVLSTWAMEPPGEVSTQAYSNFRKDGTSAFTSAGELLLEGQSIYDLFQEGYASVYNLTTSEVTWTIQYRSTSGTFPVGIKNTAILMLALDDPQPPPQTPRIYYTTSSTALSSFTGNTDYNEKVSLTFTPNANKTYAIFWSVVASGSSITNFNNVRLRKTTGTPETYQEFEIDRDELLEEQSLTDFALYTAPASPTEESFAIEGKTSVITDAIYLSDAHITALELSDEDIFVSASASVSTNVNTYTTTDSITVGTGNWYIFGSAGVNVDTTTMPSSGLMGVIISGTDGTSYMELDAWYPESTNNWTPYWAMVSTSVVNSTTYNLQYRDNTDGSTSLRYRKLLALKKSGFYESYFTGSYDVSTTGQTEVTKVTLTATPTVSGNNLVLSTWMLQRDAAIQGTSNLLKDGTTVFDYAGELLFEGQEINDLFQEGYTRVYNLPTNQVQWSLRFRSLDAGGNVEMKNAAILMLGLDTPSPSTGGVPATISLLTIGNAFTVRQIGSGNFVVGTQ